jgi:hypothetical protein
MKINQLIKELQQIKKIHGNLEVTCIATCLTEDIDIHPILGNGVWESTVEHLIVKESNKIFDEKRVRLYF